MNTRRLLLLGLIAIGVLVILVFGFAVRSQQSNRPEPPHKTKFLGFEELLPIGVTQDQILSSQLAIRRYLVKSGQEVDVVQLGYGSVKKLPRNRESADNDKAKFLLSFDGKAYDVRLEIIGFKSIRIELFERGEDMSLFDSGKVDPPTEDQEDTSL